MAISRDELCARYQKLWVPVVCDAMYQLGIPEPVLPSWLRPLLPEQRIAGIAFTVLGRGINPPVGWDEGIERISSYLRVFEQLQPGDLIVSVTTESHVGHFGELTGNAAKARGCVGVILDGNLRDIEGLRDIGLQVFYRDVSPLNGIGRWEMLGAQIPVQVGDLTVHPGDVIVAEFDGVVVVSAADAERVLLKAEEIAGAESRVRREVSTGASPMSSFERHGHI
jgi:regulator of RNase E activity RraA